MSEIPTTITFRKEYTREELEDALSSHRFGQMRPNYDQEGALHPSSLNAEMITPIVDAILRQDIFDEYLRHCEPSKKFRIELPNIGTLESIGGGESKLVFKLTTNEGKRMAVSIIGYRTRLGIQVPEDPRIYMTDKSPTRISMFYSDLRTYLILPVSYEAEESKPFYGIAFQEYADYSLRRAVLAPASATLAGRRVEGYIRRYMRRHGYPKYEILGKEYKAHRHRFLIKGRVVVIDTRIEVWTS